MAAPEYKEHQYCILHLSEHPSGGVVLNVCWEPWPDFKNSSHVPNDVEAAALRMIEVAKAAGVRLVR